MLGPIQERSEFGGLHLCMNESESKRCMFPPYLLLHNFDKETRSWENSSEKFSLASNSGVFCNLFLGSLYNLLKAGKPTLGVLWSLSKCWLSLKSEGRNCQRGQLWSKILINVVFCGNPQRTPTSFSDPRLPYVGHHAIEQWLGVHSMS